MSEKKRTKDIETALAMLGDEDVSETLLSDLSLKPSRSLADLLLLMMFLEKREEKIKREIASAIASAQQSEFNSDIRKMLAERVLKLMDRMEESMDAMTSIMTIFFSSIAGKAVNKNQN
ncbi:MAG: hypothetical protein QXE70_10340, partial [Ignisphaera sp.]